MPDDSALGGEPDGGARYRFGVLERRGLVAGWRAGQVAALGAGLLLAVGIFRVLPSLPGALAALCALGVSVWAATWPVRGRTVEEWAPDALRYVSERLLGHSLRHARAPESGFVSPPAATPGERPFPAGRNRGRAGGRASGPFPAGRARGVLVPGPFDTMSIMEVPLGARGMSGEPASHGVGRGVARGLGQESVGVLYDAARRTYTVVLAGRSPGFLLLEASQRDGRVASWSRVLAATACEGTRIHRIQWLVRSFPDGAGRPRRSMRERATLEASSPPVRSYEGLIDEVGRSAESREVLLAISVRAKPGRGRGLLGNGGFAGLFGGRSRTGVEQGQRATVHSESCAALLAEAASLKMRLADADVYADGPLGPGALGGVLSGAFSDPGGEAPWRAWPWPMALQAEWGRVRVDGTWHATYWVEEWPRLDVAADFLAPLLLVRGARRTVSLVMEPMSPAAAARQVEQRRTAGIADAELRSRGGFLATARRLREEETLARREAELADGHGQLRFSGYVTVSAPDPDALDQGCERTLQAAAQSGLALRLCYGDQMASFAFCMPLCRGLG